MILGFFLVASVATLDFGAPEISGSWIAGCDNRSDCVITNLPTDEEGIGDERDSEVGVEIQIARAYDVTRPITVTLNAGWGKEAARQLQGSVVRIDGRPLPLRPLWNDGTATFTAGDAARLARAMRSAERLEIVSGTKVLANASIDGLLPLLTLADRVQKRMGTTAALAVPGQKPATPRTIPPREPDAPIAAPPLSSAPSVTLSAEKFADILRSDPCREYSDKDALQPEVEYVRLDRDTTLALVGTYCGGYNPTIRLFLVDNDGSARPAPFGPHPFFDPAETETTLPGAWWDDKAHILRSFGRARGLGDCGEQVHYAWDGQAFQTVEYASMPECRGSYRYAVTYRKDVRR